MTVQELIEKLEQLDPELTVSVFDVRGDYDEPSVSLVMKDNRIDRVTIAAARDE